MAKMLKASALLLSKPYVMHCKQSCIKMKQASWLSSWHGMQVQHHVAKMLASSTAQQGTHFSEGCCADRVCKSKLFNVGSSICCSNLASAASRSPQLLFSPRRDKTLLWVLPTLSLLVSTINELAQQSLHATLTSFA